MAPAGDAAAAKPPAVVRVGHLVPPPPPPPPAVPAPPLAPPVAAALASLPPQHRRQPPQHPSPTTTINGGLRHGGFAGARTGGGVVGGNMVKRTATPPTLTPSSYPPMHYSKAASNLSAHTNTHFAAQRNSLLPASMQQRTVPLPATVHRAAQPRAHPKPRVIIQHAPPSRSVVNAARVHHRRSSINNRIIHSNSVTTTTVHRRSSLASSSRGHSVNHVAPTPHALTSTLTAPRTRTRVHRDFSTARVPSTTAVPVQGSGPPPPTHTPPFQPTGTATNASFCAPMSVAHGTTANSLLSNFTVAQYSMGAPPPPPPPPPHPHMNFVEIPTPPSFGAHTRSSYMIPRSTSGEMNSSVSSHNKHGLQPYGLRKRRQHLTSVPSCPDEDDVIVDDNGKGSDRHWRRRRRSQRLLAGDNGADFAAVAMTSADSDSGSNEPLSSSGSSATDTDDESYGVAANSAHDNADDFVVGDRRSMSASQRLRRRRNRRRRHQRRQQKKMRREQPYQQRRGSMSSRHSRHMPTSIGSSSSHLSRGHGSSRRSVKRPQQTVYATRRCVAARAAGSVSAGGFYDMQPPDEDDDDGGDDDHDIGDEALTSRDAVASTRRSSRLMQRQERQYLPPPHADTHGGEAEGDRERDFEDEDEDDAFSPEVAALLPSQRDGGRRSRSRRGSSASVGSSHRGSGTRSVLTAAAVGNGSGHALSSSGLVGGTPLRFSTTPTPSSVPTQAALFSPQVGSVAVDFSTGASAGSHHNSGGAPTSLPLASTPAALAPPPRNYLKLSQQSMNKPPRPLHAQSRKRKHDGSSPAAPGGVTTHLLHNPLFGHPDHVASHFPSLDFCDDLEHVDTSYSSGLSSVPLMTQTVDMCPSLGLSGSVASGATSFSGPMAVPLHSLSLGANGTMSLPSVTSASLLASSHLSQPLPQTSATFPASCPSSVSAAANTRCTSASVHAPAATGVQPRIASPPLTLSLSTNAQDSVSHSSAESSTSAAGSGSSKLPLPPPPHVPYGAPSLLPQLPTALRSASNMSFLSVDTPPPLPSCHMSGANGSVNNSFMTPERARAYEALYELSPNYESPPSTAMRSLTSLIDSDADALKGAVAPNVDFQEIMEQLELLDEEKATLAAMSAAPSQCVSPLGLRASSASGDAVVTAAVSASSTTPELEQLSLLPLPPQADAIADVRRLETPPPPPLPPNMNGLEASVPASASGVSMTSASEDALALSPVPFTTPMSVDDAHSVSLLTDDSLCAAPLATRSTDPVTEPVVSSTLSLCDKEISRSSADSFLSNPSTDSFGVTIGGSTASSTLACTVSSMTHHTVAASSSTREMPVPLPRVNSPHPRVNSPHTPPIPSHLRFSPAPSHKVASLRSPVADSPALSGKLSPFDSLSTMLGDSPSVFSTVEDGSSLSHCSPALPKLRPVPRSRLSEVKNVIGVKTAAQGSKPQALPSSTSVSPTATRAARIPPTCSSEVSTATPHAAPVKLRTTEPLPNNDKLHALPYPASLYSGSAYEPVTSSPVVPEPLTLKPLSINFSSDIDGVMTSSTKATRPKSPSASSRGSTLASPAPSTSESSAVAPNLTLTSTDDSTSSRVIPPSAAPTTSTSTDDSTSSSSSSSSMSPPAATTTSTETSAPPLDSATPSLLPPSSLEAGDVVEDAVRSHPGRADFVEGGEAGSNGNTKDFFTENCGNHEKDIGVATQKSALESTQCEPTSNDAHRVTEASSKTKREAGGVRSEVAMEEIGENGDSCDEQTAPTRTAADLQCHNSSDEASTISSSNGGSGGGHDCTAPARKATTARAKDVGEERRFTSGSDAGGHGRPMPSEEDAVSAPAAPTSPATKVCESPKIEPASIDLPLQKRSAQPSSSKGDTFSLDMHPSSVSERDVKQKFSPSSKLDSKPCVTPFEASKFVCPEHDKKPIFAKDCKVTKKEDDCKPSTMTCPTVEKTETCTRVLPKNLSFSKAGEEPKRTYESVRCPTIPGTLDNKPREHLASSHEKGNPTRRVNLAASETRDQMCRAPKSRAPPSGPSAAAACGRHSQSHGPPSISHRESPRECSSGDELPSPRAAATSAATESDSCRRVESASPSKVQSDVVNGGKQPHPPSHVAESRSALPRQSAARPPSVSPRTPADKSRSASPLASHRGRSRSATLATNHGESTATITRSAAQSPTAAQDTPSSVASSAAITVAGKECRSPRDSTHRRRVGPPTSSPPPGIVLDAKKLPPPSPTAEGGPKADRNTNVKVKHGLPRSERVTIDLSLDDLDEEANSKCTRKAPLSTSRQRDSNSSKSTTKKIGMGFALPAKKTDFTDGAVTAAGTLGGDSKDAAASGIRIFLKAGAFAKSTTAKNVSKSARDAEDGKSSSHQRQGSLRERKESSQTRSVQVNSRAQSDRLSRGAVTPPGASESGAEVASEPASATSVVDAHTAAVATAPVVSGRTTSSPSSADNSTSVKVARQEKTLDNPRKKPRLNGDCTAVAASSGIKVSWKKDAKAPVIDLASSPSPSPPDVRDPSCVGVPAPIQLPPVASHSMYNPSSSAGSSLSAGSTPTTLPVCTPADGSVGARPPNSSTLSVCGSLAHTPRLLPEVRQATDIHPSQATWPSPAGTSWPASSLTPMHTVASGGPWRSSSLTPTHTVANSSTSGGSWSSPLTPTHTVSSDSGGRGPWRSSSLTPTHTFASGSASGGPWRSSSLTPTYTVSNGSSGPWRSSSLTPTHRGGCADDRIGGGDRTETELAASCLGSSRRDAPRRAIKLTDWFLEPFTVTRSSDSTTQMGVRVAGRSVHMRRTSRLSGAIVERLSTNKVSTRNGVFELKGPINFSKTAQHFSPSATHALRCFEHGIPSDYVELLSPHWSVSGGKSPPVASPARTSTPSQTLRSRRSHANAISPPSARSRSPARRERSCRNASAARSPRSRSRPRSTSRDRKRRRTEGGRTPAAGVRSPRHASHRSVTSRGSSGMVGKPRSVSRDRRGARSTSNSGDLDREDLEDSPRKVPTPTNVSRCSKRARFQENDHSSAPRVANHSNVNTPDSHGAEGRTTQPSCMSTNSELVETAGALSTGAVGGGHKPHSPSDTDASDSVGSTLTTVARPVDFASSHVPSSTKRSSSTSPVSTSEPSFVYPAKSPKARACDVFPVPLAFADRATAPDADTSSKSLYDDLSSAPLPEVSPRSQSVTPECAVRPVSSSLKSREGVSLHMARRILESCDTSASSTNRESVEFAANSLRSGNASSVSLDKMSKEKQPIDVVSVDPRSTEAVYPVEKTPAAASTSRRCSSSAHLDSEESAITRRSSSSVDRNMRESTSTISSAAFVEGQRTVEAALNGGEAPMRASTSPSSTTRTTKRKQRRRRSEYTSSIQGDRDREESDSDGAGPALSAADSRTRTKRRRHAARERSRGRSALGRRSRERSNGRSSRAQARYDRGARSRSPVVRDHRDMSRSRRRQRSRSRSSTRSRSPVGSRGEANHMRHDRGSRTRRQSRSPYRRHGDDRYRTSSRRYDYNLRDASLPSRDARRKRSSPHRHDSDESAHHRRSDRYSVDRRKRQCSDRDRDSHHKERRCRSAGRSRTRSRGRTSVRSRDRADSWERSTSREREPQREGQRYPREAVTRKHTSPLSKRSRKEKPCNSSARSRSRSSTSSVDAYSRYRPKSRSTSSEADDWRDWKREKRCDSANGNLRRTSRKSRVGARSHCSRSLSVISSDGSRSRSSDSTNSNSRYRPRSRSQLLSPSLSRSRSPARKIGRTDRHRSVSSASVAPKTQEDDHSRERSRDSTTSRRTRQHSRSRSPSRSRDATDNRHRHGDAREGPAVKRSPSRLPRKKRKFDEQT